MPKKRTIRRLLTGFVPAISAGAIGAIASKDAPAVYGDLDKPEWAPPAEVFGPVWSGLYALIGYSGFRMASLKLPKRVWGLHYLQLGVNASWSWALLRARNKEWSLTGSGALHLVVTAAAMARWPRDGQSALRGVA